MPKYLCILVMLSNYIFADSYQLQTPRSITPMYVQSWKQLRDQGIEKQDLDYSCGSAAVATILRYYYGMQVYEKDILTEVENIGNDGAASFSDLQKTVKVFGFNATGISTDIDTLKTIKIPVLIYLKYRGQDHFTVLRGISDSYVLLADPSWGNRIFPIHQFRKLWEQNGLNGHILIIVPETVVTINPDFFRMPVVSALPFQLLELR